MKCLCVGFTLLLLLPGAPPVHAGAAMDAVQKNVDRVLQILRDPAEKAKLIEGHDQKVVESVYQQMFDEVELSKRALGRNWNSLDVDQRQEFVRLFRRLLENAYLNKILSYTGEKVVFDREIPLSANLAEVRTEIISPSRTVHVNYRMILKNGSWKVYDVVVENVSLVENYRSQFNEILSKKTPAEMMDILRKKVKE